MREEDFERESPALIAKGLGESDCKKSKLKGWFKRHFSPGAKAAPTTPPVTKVMVTPLHRYARVYPIPDRPRPPGACKNVYEYFGTHIEKAYNPQSKGETEETVPADTRFLYEYLEPKFLLFSPHSKQYRLHGMSAADIEPSTMRYITTSGKRTWLTNRKEIPDIFTRINLQQNVQTPSMPKSRSLDSLTSISRQVEQSLVTQKQRKLPKGPSKAAESSKKETCSPIHTHQYGNDRISWTGFPEQELSEEDSLTCARYALNESESSVSYENNSSALQNKTAADFYERFEYSNSNSDSSHRSDNECLSNDKERLNVSFSVEQKSLETDEKSEIEETPRASQGNGSRREQSRIEPLSSTRRSPTLKRKEPKHSQNEAKFHTDIKSKKVCCALPLELRSSNNLRPRVSREYSRSREHLSLRSLRNVQKYETSIQTSHTSIEDQRWLHKRRSASNEKRELSKKSAKKTDRRYGNSPGPAQSVQERRKTLGKQQNAKVSGSFTTYCEVFFFNDPPEISTPKMPRHRTNNTAGRVLEEKIYSSFRGLGLSRSSKTSFSEQFIREERRPELEKTAVVKPSKARKERPPNREPSISRSRKKQTKLSSELRMARPSRRSREESEQGRRHDWSLHRASSPRRRRTLLRRPSSAKEVQSFIVRSTHTEENSKRGDKKKPTLVPKSKSSYSPRQMWLPGGSSSFNIQSPVGCRSSNAWKLNRNSSKRMSVSLPQGLQSVGVRSPLLKQTLVKNAIARLSISPVAKALQSLGKIEDRKSTALETSKQKSKTDNKRQSKLKHPHSKKRDVDNARNQHKRYVDSDSSSDCSYSESDCSNKS